MQSTLANWLALGALYLSSISATKSIIKHLHTKIPLSISLDPEKAFSDAAVYFIIFLVILTLTAFLMAWDRKVVLQRELNLILNPPPTATGWKQRIGWHDPSSFTPFWWIWLVSSILSLTAGMFFAISGKYINAAIMIYILMAFLSLAVFWNTRADQHQVPSASRKTNLIVFKEQLGLQNSSPMAVVLIFSIILSALLSWQEYHDSRIFKFDSEYIQIESRNYIYIDENAHQYFVVNLDNSLLSISKADPSIKKLLIREYLFDFEGCWRVSIRTLQGISEEKKFYSEQCSPEHIKKYSSPNR